MFICFSDLGHEVKHVFKTTYQNGHLSIKDCGSGLFCLDYVYLVLYPWLYM